jgi:hypothetical protein
MIWIARGFWALTIVLALASVLVGSRATRSIGFLTPELFFVLFVTGSIVAIGYATAGMLILRQRLGHAVGWLLLVAGVLLVLVFAFSFVFFYEMGGQNHAFAAWVSLFGTIVWWPALLLAGPVIALVFPDGHLPSPRWKVPTMIVLGTVLAVLVLYTLRPGPIAADLPENPIGVVSIPGWVYEVLDALFTPVVIIAPIVLAVAAVVTRFRSASGDARQQLKWFTFAVLVWGGIFAASLIPASGEFAILSLGALLLIPASIVVAISRYRLYEIDNLINRTLVYLLLIGIVAGLYAGLVVLFQRLFVLATGDTSDAAAVISALILAAAFHPIRKLIEGVVDRWFRAKEAPSAAQPSMPLDDPEFETKVESIVRRILSESSPPTRRVAKAKRTGLGAG